ncbi:hypothetical protein BDZ89DRAFT_1072464, partial [Hymenopellis radicata]
MTSPSVDVSALCHPYIMSNSNPTCFPPSTFCSPMQSSFLSPLREVDAAVERAAIQMLHDLPNPPFPHANFGFYAKQDTYNNVFGDDRNAGPFKLGHISHKWRSIAHSYTDLWKHTLKLEVKSGAKLRDPLSLLNFHVVVTSRIVKALLGVFPRWQSAAFRCLPLAVVPLLSTISPPARAYGSLQSMLVPIPPGRGRTYCRFFSLLLPREIRLEGIPFSNISLPCGALRDFTHSSLTSLTTSDAGLLDILNLPALSELVILHPTLTCCGALDVLAQIERLVQQSACDLTRLFLVDCDIELLLSTPIYNTSFEFTVEISDDESCMTGLVEAMSRRDSILVPKLESLRYFDDGHGLKRVNIEFEALHPEDEVTLSGENWARLVVMKRAGLDIPFCLER